MPTKRFLTLFWCLAFTAIIMGGAALLWLGHPQSLPQLQQKMAQVQYDVGFQLSRRLRAGSEMSWSALLGTWLVSMGGLGIALPLLFGLIICWEHLNRSLSGYPDLKTGHWKIIFKSVRQIYWRLNIFRFEKLAAHLLLLGMLLFAVQIWWLPFCFQPLNLTGIFLLCYLCGCYIYLMVFYRHFYSWQASVRMLENRLGLKQRLTTSLELAPVKGSAFRMALIAQTAEKLAGQKMSRLFPHSWPFISRRAFFYQLACITLAALMLDWAGPSLVASYYVPRISDKYTRKLSAKPDPLDNLLIAQAQELDRLSREMYPRRDSLDPQIMADKLAALADELGNLATQSGQLEGAGLTGQILNQKLSRLASSSAPQEAVKYAGESDAGVLSRLAKQFLSPVVMSVNQPKETSTADRKTWLDQTSRKLKEWQGELRDIMNQADSQPVGVVLSSPLPTLSQTKKAESNAQPEAPADSVAAQLKEIARKMEGLKITSNRDLPAVTAIKSNLLQQAEQLKQMADKIEKAGKNQDDQVDFSEQYRQIAKELAEMSKREKDWNSRMDALHIQANAGGSQFRQLGYLSNPAFPVKLDRGGTTSNTLADARVIMGEKGSSDKNAAPKFRVAGESDPHYHPKVTDLTTDEADTSSQPDIGERAAAAARGEYPQGSAPEHDEKQEEEQKRGQGPMLSGEKSAAHPGSSPSAAAAQFGSNPEMAADLEQLSQLKSLTQAAEDTLQTLKANLGAGASAGGHKPTGVEELAQAAADMEALANQVQWTGDTGNATADMLKNQAGRELKRMAGQLGMLAEKQAQQQNRNQNSLDNNQQSLQKKLGEEEKRLAELSSQLNNAAMGLLGDSSKRKAGQSAGGKAQANLDSIADELNRLAGGIADGKFNDLSNRKRQAKFTPSDNKPETLPDNAQADYQAAGGQLRKNHQEKGDGFDKRKLQQVADGMEDIDQKIDKLEKELKHPERQDNDQYESQQALITDKMQQLGQELRSQFQPPGQVQLQTRRLGLEMESFSKGVSSWGNQATEMKDQPDQKSPPTDKKPEEADSLDAELTAMWLNLTGGKPGGKETPQQKQNEQKIASQFSSAGVRYTEKQFSAMDKLQQFLQDVKQLEQKVLDQQHQANADKSGNSRKESSPGAASNPPQIQQGQGKLSPYPQDEKLDSQDTFERIVARVQSMYQEVAALGMGDMPKGYQVPHSDLSQFKQPEGLGDIRPLTAKEKEQYVSRPVNKRLPNPLPHNTAISYKPESAPESFTEVNFTLKGDSPYTKPDRAAADNHALSLHQVPTMDRAVQQQTVPLAYRKIIQSLYQRNGEE